MRKISTIGYHLGDRLDLKGIKSGLTFDNIYADPTELIYQTDTDSYFQIFDYGSIVFLGIEKTIQTQIINAIRQILQLDLKELMSENFDVEINPDVEYHVFFDRIVLKEINMNIAKIVMLNIAQSIALDYFIEQSNLLLAQTRQFSTELEEQGRFSLKGKKLMQSIGKTLNLKIRIAENLYIFDTPLLSWNDEFLNTINDDLNRELDIQVRYKSLQENLRIVKENLDIYKDITQHTHSSTLEWIIIILIAVEIVNMILEKIFPT